ncbi:MAG: succinate dehydrogenase/fumarate reductase iron-sulfur subunit [Calditrichaeota bacterium]|nr:MAG: succinate dehydrogenase/fumarate reductase iron-sulfur subunit [Calditrichota bacterium]MBL1205678.1 succinate dehydrogenase/fumarate reductase iron-sulfur subunit [Calditrichota bacterium]NOG45506.1 succinate dehydrogenase/fumarate reductase iron-sulfur subunit [Calditrichota bacterium]
MNLTLKIWRQKNADSSGKMVEYIVKDVSTEMSFLEMLDVLNEDLTLKGEDPVEFDSDCREGICGTCGVVINGIAHGEQRATTVCQLHMRHFNDGETITIEPWRARAFPVIKDLVVDRNAFDRIMAQGGYVSIKTGSAAEANSILVPKEDSDIAMDMASCIGCGACVASCPNASASLFVGAKISQLALLPQGKIEAKERAENMVAQMDKEMFGACTNIQECEAVCPKEISISAIARMRREYVKAALK